MGFSLWIITRWVVVLLALLSLASATPWRRKNVPIKCGVCDESRCPELHYCEGEAVKDQCGCCRNVCSSSKYQPHSFTFSESTGRACAKVKCPKFKVCLENEQNLPLCTCPSPYICKSRSRSRKRQRQVCGTNGITYQSRCFLRITACNSATRIKVAHKGACVGDPNAGGKARGNAGGSGSGNGGGGGKRPCESFSACRRRKNQRPVCGTDGKTYISKCHMKLTACQKGVKIKLRNHGVCSALPDLGYPQLAGRKKNNVAAAAAAIATSGGNGGGSSNKHKKNRGLGSSSSSSGSSIIKHSSGGGKSGGGSSSSGSSMSSVVGRGTTVNDAAMVPDTTGVRRRKGRRKRKKNGGGGKVPGETEEELQKRRQRRREKRKKRKQRRRKRRGKSRFRRNKVDKNGGGRFRRPFDDIKHWQ